MQYAYGKGRKHRTKPKFDARDPHGLAICDGCGFLVQHSHLREKKDYRGGSVPVGLSLRVCASCDDVPQPYFSRLLLRPDPVPLQNPRPDSNNPETNAQTAAANAYSDYLNILYGLK
jgi:hypothetical protein